MGKLFEGFKSDQEAKTLRYCDVVSNSMLLQRELGMPEDQLREFVRGDGVISCGKYDIVGTHRIFGNWTNLLEVFPSGSKHSAPWITGIHSRGTGTTNIPPPHVIEYVVDYIRKHN